MAFRKVARIDELWIGEMKGVIVGGKKVLLIHGSDTVHAFENRCVHQEVELSQGVLEGDVLTCFAHHWQYNVTNGCGINPAGTRLRTFAVVVKDGEILVDVDQVIAERKGRNPG